MSLCSDTVKANISSLGLCVNLTAAVFLQSVFWQMNFPAVSTDVCYNNKPVCGVCLPYQELPRNSWCFSYSDLLSALVSVDSGSGVLQLSISGSLLLLIKPVFAFMLPLNIPSCCKINCRAVFTTFLKEQNWIRFAEIAALLNSRTVIPSTPWNHVWVWNIHPVGSNVAVKAL